MFCAAQSSSLETALRPHPHGCCSVRLSPVAKGIKLKFRGLTQALLRVCN